MMLADSKSVNVQKYKLHDSCVAVMFRLVECLFKERRLYYLVKLFNNTIQYNTIGAYNTIQYNTIQYNTIQYNTIQYNHLYLTPGRPYRQFQTLAHLSYSPTININSPTINSSSSMSHDTLIINTHLVFIATITHHLSNHSFIAPFC